MAVNIDTNVFMDKVAEEYLLVFKQKVYYELACATLERENEELLTKVAELEKQLDLAREHTKSLKT
jgi:hypothetical protein